MVWLILFQYHIGRGHVGATMKAKLYHLLEHRASEWYLFISILILWICGILDFMFSTFFYPWQPIFCDSSVEGKWIHDNVCSRFDKKRLIYLFVKINNCFELKLYHTWLMICIWERWKCKYYFPSLCRYYNDIIYLLDVSIWENLKDWMKKKRIILGNCWGSRIRWKIGKTDKDGLGAQVSLMKESLNIVGGINWGDFKNDSSSFKSSPTYKKWNV